MDNILAHIHIFKTNIQKENLGEIKKVFTNHAISNWTVDTEDCDHVLRVVSHEMTESQIIALVSQYGFECADLV